MTVRRLGTVTVWAAFLVVAAALVAHPTAGAAADAAPAILQVGAATRSLDPTVPVYSGGFGLSPAITHVHDPLSARAIAVSNGRHAVVMEVIDAQGFFASNQEGPYGITAIRQDAARAITALGGPQTTQADIIVQASHGHAAPTLEGIWGPVPLDYFRQVHDQSVAALVDAVRFARAAHVQWATIDASLLDTTVIDTDSYPGWSADGQLTVLRAVDATDTATIATYAEIPVHGAHVCGQCLALLSADYFGVVRDDLERKLGGVAVVGASVLGRQESPVEVTDIPTMTFFGAVVSNFVTQALGHAHWLTDTTISSSERFVSFPATNAALLALNHAWRLPDDVKTREAQTSGIYPIDRDDTPPYLDGTMIGTWLTSLRIGSLVYASMPGEPFPEVSHAVYAHTAGADLVTVMSKGQDDLGYFYPAWVYPFVFAYGDDHHIFNVAPQAGDVFITGQLANIAALGFPTTQYTTPEPLQTNHAQDLLPGLQGLGAPLYTDAGPDCVAAPAFEAVYAPPAVLNSPSDGPVSWDFGDGTSATSGYLINTQNYPQSYTRTVGEARFTHAFGPGSHVVRLRQSDQLRQTATWQLTVRVNPPLAAGVEATATATRDFTYSGSTNGGDGNILAWRWSFSDGATASGQRVAHAFPVGVQPVATLTVTDATGTMASAAVRGTGSVVAAIGCTAGEASRTGAPAATSASVATLPNTLTARPGALLQSLIAIGLLATLTTGCRRLRRGAYALSAAQASKPPSRSETSAKPRDAR